MNEKIGIQDLVVLLAKKADITKKDAETLLKECFDIMENKLLEDKLLKIRNLGTFKLIRVENRESVDVSTGERVLIPAHYKVTFSPDIELAETVNAPFASLENVEMEDETIPDDEMDDEIEYGEEIEENFTNPVYPEEPEINEPEPEESEFEEMKEEPEEIKTLYEEESDNYKREMLEKEDNQPTKSNNILFWIFFLIASGLLLFFA